MRRLWMMVFVGGISAVLILFSPADARITGAWIEPADPTPDDTVVLHLEGYLPDACWGVESHTVTQDNCVITAEVNGVDGWIPEYSCLQMIVPYAFTDTLGFLLSGQYLVNIREHRESPRMPGDEFQSFAFTVAGGNTTCACPCHGDLGCDAVCNVIDVVRAVNVAFRGEAPSTGSCCPFGLTDVSCDGVTNVTDVVKFVNVAFRGGDAQTEFCDPCDQ